MNVCENAGRWFLLIVSCIGATAALAALSLLSRRSWPEYMEKILAQFGPTGIAGNNVSLTRALDTLGINDSPLPLVVSVGSLIVLVAMFARGTEKEFHKALPRRALVLLGALGWVARQWLNYYSIAMLLLLPLLARKHRVGAPVAAIGLAISYVLPEFNDVLLHDYPVLAMLKVAPYILVPAWLVFLELRSIGLSPRALRATVIVGGAFVLLTVAEAWRAHTIRGLERTGYEHFTSERPQRALESYERLLKLSPRNAEGFMRRAVVKTVLDDLSGAERDFLRAIELAPENTDARRNYGNVLLKAGFVEAAARQFEDSYHFLPDDSGVLYDLARARLQQDRASEAASLLTRARELDPVNASIERLLERITPATRPEE